MVRQSHGSLQPTNKTRVHGQSIRNESRRAYGNGPPIHPTISLRRNGTNRHVMVNINV